MKIGINIVCVLALLLGVSCAKYTPKPKGYLRFDLPQKEYVLFDSTCPYKFEYPAYGQMIKKNNEDCWYDFSFPQYQSTIHLSYKPIKNNLPILLEDAHEFISKHTIKADAIEDVFIINNKQDAVGLLFDIGGNVATSVQFFVTDSVNHFLRGSLYFYSAPNRDSLAPLIDFFKEDIEHIMKTIEFK